MPRNFSIAQIHLILEESQILSCPEVCQKYQITPAILMTWKSQQIAASCVSENPPAYSKKIEILSQENQRLRQIIHDLYRETLSLRETMEEV